MTASVPAATVILLRDGDAGPETLMLRRSSEIAFAGMWVFPGGRIDDVDWADQDDLQVAARNAAVREAEEEAGIIVDADQFVWLSHWEPPPRVGLRFAAFFFVTRAPAGEIVVDGCEIHEHRWLRPADAMQRRDDGQIELAPPTWVTLCQLSQHGSVDEVLTSAGEAEFFRTQPATGERPRVLLWHGDAGYDDGDASRPGPRHRLIMGERWEYIRS